MVILTWIYLMRDKATGFYKIGQSSDPRRRLKDLCRQDTKQPAPNDYELIEAWWAPNTFEFDLHNTHHAQRRRGEWFELSSKHLTNIRRFFIGRQPYTVDIREAADSELQVVAADNVRLRRELEWAQVRRESVTDQIWKKGQRDAETIHELHKKIGELQEQIHYLKKTWRPPGTLLASLPTLGKRTPPNG